MILSNVKFYAAQRLDLEDMLALFSAARTDAQLYTKQFLSNQNYILKGFGLSGIGLTSATMAMTNATFIIGGGTSDFSYFIAPNGVSDIVIPPTSLVISTRNFIELSLTTQTSTPVVRAIWDPSANGGLGAEFNQTVNTMTDLVVTPIVLQGGFSGLPDRVPVGIIDCDGSGTIKVILDERSLFWRLGTPSNPAHNYSWGSQTEPAYSINIPGATGTFVAGEIVTFSGGATAIVFTGGTTNIQIILPTNPADPQFFSGNTITGGTSGASGTVNTITQNFTGADKSILNGKNNDDAIKTEIKRIKGTPNWFSSQFNSLQGISTAVNSAIVPVSDGASFFWDGSNFSITDSNVSPAGSDVLAKIRLFGTSQQLSLSRQDGTGGSSTVPIADGQVMFISLPASGNRTYSGTGSGSTNYQVVSSSSFVISDTNYWLAYREGTKIFIRNQGDLSPGEEDPIGDTIPTTLLNNIGLVDVETPANYSSNIRGTNGESIVSREGVLTDAVGDEQEDRSGYIRSDQLVTWDGANLTFAADIVLEFVNTKSGTLTQHKILASNSPIALSASGQSIYSSIVRSTTSENLTPINSGITPIPAQTQATKDIFVFFRRVDVGGISYVHLPFMKQLIAEGQSVRLGQSGSGSGTIKATFYDPTSSTLPTGATITIDGIAGSNGDTVLFSNLGSGNNEIYTLGGVGTSITWTATRPFSNQLTPTAGDQVIILKGNSFANQVGEFDGTTFNFNKITRYFNGTDYWEQTSLITSNLSDNTTSSIFTVTALGSENIMMDFSILRNGKKETQTLYITNDGTNADIAVGGAYIAETGLTGVSFSAAIVTGNLILSYTTDSQGIGGILKYSLKRWSDSPGGPGGPPSYSGGGGSSGTPGGPSSSIQFNNGGVFGGDANFEIDTTNQALNLNGLRQTVLSSGLTIADNISSPTSLFSFSASLWPFAIIEYSIIRNGIYQLGIFMVTNDGTTVGFGDTNVITSSTGVSFTADVSGGNVRILYTSSSTGFVGTYKFSMRRWS